MRKRICLTFEEFVNENKKDSLIESSNQELEGVKVRVEDEDKENSDAEVIELDYSTDEAKKIIQELDAVFPSEIKDRREGQ